MLYISRFLHNKLFKLHKESYLVQLFPITSLDHPRDTPVNTTIRSSLLCTSTTSTLSHQHPPSPIQLYTTHYSLTTYARSHHRSLYLTLFLLRTGLFIRLASLSIPHHRRYSQVHRICSVFVTRSTIERATLRSSTLQSAEKCR